MTERNNRLKFSHKKKRARTIEKPRSTPLPAPLRDWLKKISARLRALIFASEEKGEEPQKKQHPPAE